MKGWKRTAAAALLGAAALLAAQELRAAREELMPTRIVRAGQLRAQEGSQGTVRTYFDAPTSTLIHLGLRETTLAPGATPHPTRPYSHAIESVIVVKEGVLELALDAAQPTRVERLDAGSAVFLGPNQWHQLRNASAAPVVFYELDWVSPGMNGEPDYPEDEINARGIQRRRGGP